MGQGPHEIREEIDQTRARMGDTVEALGYKTDVKTRAKEKLSRANRATPGREDVKQGARRAAGIAQENPIGLAIGSVAVGFLAGMLVPSTRVEDEKLGEASDHVIEKAKQTAQEKAQDVKEQVSS